MAKKQATLRVNHSKTKIVIIAGEASGDNLGAKLIKAVLARDNFIEFQGVGGDKMLAAGLSSSIFPMSDISVMGYFEIIWSLPKILWRMEQTYQFIRKYKPDLIITIDSPGFNFRLVTKLKNSEDLSIPIIHYVAPTVWAYKPERAQKIAQLYDHLLVILPFEKPYFDDVNLPCTYIGHPVVEDVSPSFDAKQVKIIHNIKAEATLLTIAPGSRLGEIQRHMPIICKVILSLTQQNRDLLFIIPTLPHLKELIDKYCKAHNISKFVRIEINDVTKFSLLAISTAALVKSGTMAMEVAKLNIPMVVMYKASPMTAYILKKQLKIKYVNICNLILDAPIIPELLQEHCTANNIEKELAALLDPHSKNRMLQQAAFVQIMKILGDSGPYTPSDKAAETILEYIALPL